MSRLNHSVASAIESGHFPQFIKLDFKDTLIRKVNPYAVLDKIAEVTGETPVSLVSETRSSYAIKTKTRHQATNILTI